MPVSEITHPIVHGMLARDAAAMRATLAPDIVLRSPLTAVPFEGIDEVMPVLEAIAETYVAYELLGDWRDGSTYLFHGRMRFRGGEVDLLERLELDPDDRVREQIICGRPLAGTALFAAEVGPRLAEMNRGARAAGAVRALARPLPALLRGADAIGARLTRAR